MNNFTIKRSEWLRGNPNTASLLDRYNNKCCLGFFSLACGLTKNQIDRLTHPSQVIEENLELKPEVYPDWVLAKTFHNSIRNSSDINSLIKINDDTEINDSEREEKIKEIFAKHNITVEFED